MAQNSIAKEKESIIPGAYQTTLYFPLLKGKTIGIVANQTSMIRRVHLVDSLKSSGFKIKRVFAPDNVHWHSRSILGLEPNLLC